jgi:hypothetical protein
MENLRNHREQHDASRHLLATASFTDLNLLFPVGDLSAPDNAAR